MAGFNRRNGSGAQPNTHRFINAPNKGRQTCTACGMLREVIWNKELKENETFFTSRDGIRTSQYQQCTIESYKI